MTSIYHRKWAILALVTGLFISARAVVPPPEKLLPDDTLVVFTAPDFGKLSEVFKKMPQAQLWNDADMKPFKDKFLAKWNDEFVSPLEKDLGIKFADYTGLVQGQLTFAITQNGWQGKDEEEPGVLLLLDAKDQSEQVKKRLAELRKKCTDSGKSVRNEKVREFEFTVLSVNSNDVPKTLRKFFPKPAEVQEANDDKESKKTPEKDELVIGQIDSLLVVANSLKAAEKIATRARDGAAPSLAEVPAFQADQLARFRESPLYGWVNVKRFIDVMLPLWSEKKENPDAPNPLDIQPQKILRAIGLTALKSIAFSFRPTSDGAFFEVFFAVPESDRQGLFKILAGEPREANPPAFVPADAVKFQRWRMDGRKAYATLEKTLGEISPQAVSTLNFLIEQGNSYFREKDQSFDLKKNLIGNLGDDIVTYQKAPRGTSPAELASAPSLMLVGSPNPEQFVGALKGILVFMTQQSGNPPQEREFLGRKITSVALSLPGVRFSSAAGSSGSAMLHYAASSGYVALSTDASMIEEYLRAGESPPKTLRETAGLADAAQKVTGPSSSLFGYQNDAESMRTALEMLRKAMDTGTNSTLPSLLPLPAGVSNGEKMLREWLDFSLLPPFEKVSKYFHFSVYGGSATVDGLGLKMFSPVPPSLRR